MNPQSLRSDRDILRSLAEPLAELAALPVQDERKQLWADHQALAPTRVPVCVYWEGIPEGTWRNEILGPDYLQCADPLARQLERQMRIRLWTARNVPDDHIVWPAVWLTASVARPADWGVPLEQRRTGNELTAWKEVPPLADAIDLGRLRFTDQQIDDAATGERVERARQWLGDLLDVYVTYPDLGHSPFDLVVRLRGGEQVMFDAIERPDELNALVQRVCDGFVEHHRNREQRGQINRHLSRDGRWGLFGIRVHCCRAADGQPGRPPRLSDEWAYVSAQTSSGLGPAMYAQFVQPANVRMAEPFVRQTVYYHGCECLDQKLDAIASLPNLRRHHVSPWSSLRAAVDKFGRSAVLEVHAHPGRVFFGGDEQANRREILDLLDAGQGAAIDLNLSDIHSVGGDPHKLRRWVEIAREAIG